MLYFAVTNSEAFFIHYFYGSTQQDFSFMLEHPWNTVGPKECSDYGDSKKAAGYNWVYNLSLWQTTPALCFVMASPATFTSSS